jgi:cytochrome P450
MGYRFDPDDSGFIDDPYPTYKILRDEYPVYRHEATGFYVITRNQDVERILGDYATFSSSRGNAIVDSPVRVGKTLGSIDPPRHDELRGVIKRGLSPARIQAMLPGIEKYVKGLLAGLGDRRECELMADIGRPALYSALGRMLGLDGHAADKAADLSRQVFHAGLGAMGSPSAPGFMEEVFALLGEQLARRRTERGDDLFSILLDAQGQGAPLSDAEIIGNMSTVLLAGNASVGHYFSNFIYALWRNPDERTKLAAESGKLKAAIEEGVRWDTSTQSFGRQTTKEITLHDTIIPTDSRIVVCYGSANRDERVIADPDRFKIDRPRTPHFGFGFGPHFCLGAPAARAMLAAIFTPLLPALGDYDLDMGAAERVEHMMVRGFYKLPMRW